MHEILPVLLAIPTLGLALYFGITGIRATLNAKPETPSEGI